MNEWQKEHLELNRFLTRIGFTSKLDSYRIIARLKLSELEELTYADYSWQRESKGFSVKILIVRTTHSYPNFKKLSFNEVISFLQERGGFDIMVEELLFNSNFFTTQSKW